MYYILFQLDYILLEKEIIQNGNKIDMGIILSLIKKKKIIIIIKIIVFINNNDKMILNISIKKKNTT